MFYCISVVGCKGLLTQASENGDYIDSPGVIDRNRLICNPVVLNNIHDDNEYDEIIKLLQIEYMQSLGIQDDANLYHLIKDVYG